MRGGGGEGAEAHHHADAELACQRHHGPDERRPAEVGFGPDEIADVGAGEVVAGPNLDDGPSEPLVHAVFDVGHRASGALVDEGFAVEGGDQLCRRRPEQGGDGAVGAEPGVDPTLECHHEDGALDQGLLEMAFVDGHETMGVRHGVSSVSRAISANRTTLWANPSTLERSPAAAPPA